MTKQGAMTGSIRSHCRDYLGASILHDHIQRPTQGSIARQSPRLCPTTSINIKPQQDPHIAAKATLGLLPSHTLMVKYNKELAPRIRRWQILVRILGLRKKNNERKRE